MAAYFKIEFFDEAADGIQQLAKITNRTPVEAVCDALSIYRMDFATTDLAEGYCFFERWPPRRRD